MMTLPLSTRARSPPRVTLAAVSRNIPVAMVAGLSLSIGLRQFDLRNTGWMRKDTREMGNMARRKNFDICPKHHALKLSDY
jgi:hypothetical protein